MLYGPTEMKRCHRIDCVPYKTAAASPPFSPPPFLHPRSLFYIAFYTERSHVTTLPSPHHDGDCSLQTLLPTFHFPRYWQPCRGHGSRGCHGHDRVAKDRGCLLQQLPGQSRCQARSGARHLPVTMPDFADQRLLSRR